MKIEYERERTTPTGFPIIDRGINPTAEPVKRYADGIKNERAVDCAITRDPVISDMVGQIEDVVKNLTQCLVGVEEKLTRDTTVVNSPEYIADSTTIPDRLHNQQVALSMCMKLADRIYNMI